MKLTFRHRQAEARIEFSGALEPHLWRINWKAQGYPFCGIYALSPDNKWPTKVGISQNPVKRLNQTQTSCWKKLDICGYRYAQNQFVARAIEKKVHEILTGDGLALLGEWFDIRADKAVEVIDFAAGILGLEAMSQIPDRRIEDALLAFSESEGKKSHTSRHEDIYAEVVSDWPKGS